MKRKLPGYEKKYEKVLKNFTICGKLIIKKEYLRDTDS